MAVKREAKDVRDASADYVPLVVSPAVPEGYKKTDVGVIPEDWEVGSIDDFYEVTSSKRVFQSEWRRSGIPFYRTREIAILAENGRVDNDLYIDESLYNSYAKRYGVPADGDLLVTGIGTIGKVFLVPEKVRFYFKDASVLWFSAKDDYDSVFLKCLYQYPTVLDQISNSSTGTTVDTYTISGAKRTLVPVPPFAEQRAIATALSDVDALLEGLDRLIAKKRDLKQAVMQQLLTGQTRLPGFEREWETKQLGGLGNFLKGSGVKRDEAQSGPLACVRYGELYTTHNDYIQAFHSWISQDVAATATRLHAGDLLFAGSGETKEEIGKCVAFVANVEAYAGGDIVILRPKNVDSLFMGYALNAPCVVQQKASLGQGDAVVHISAAALAKISLVLPPVEEQTAIATVLSDMDAELEALEQRRAKTAALKQAMMQELLTGRTRLVEPEQEEAAAC